MSAYTYALDEAAVLVFASLPARRRIRLLRIFDQLAFSPQQAGDYHEPGASGRTYELRLVDDVLVTWWTDHAAKEVRIVRMERID